MRYQILFREIDQSDINRECPALPEPEDFEMHLRAFIQDIIGLPGITDVSTREGNNLAVTTQGVDLQTLKAELKPLLRHYFQCLRVSRVEEVDNLHVPVTRIAG